MISDITKVFFRDCTRNVPSTKDVFTSDAKDICFSHITDDSFRVEENVDDVVIGRLSSCLYDHRVTRTYDVISRE